MKNVWYDKKSDFGAQELPLNIKISFQKLFEFWDDLAMNGTKGEQQIALEILDKVKKAKALRKPFKDIKILDKYHKEINILMCHLFPEQLRSNDIKAGFVPFSPIFFNPSERFENILHGTGKSFEFAIRNLDPGSMYVQACIFALNVIYNVEVDSKRPFFFDIPDTGSDILRSYRIFFNGDFSSFTVNDSFKELTEEDIELLVDNYDDMGLWKEKFPPGCIDFEGFAIVSLFDVTKDEAISKLKLDLLKKDALTSPVSVERIRSYFCSLFNISDLQLGFSIFNAETQEVKSMGYGFWNGIALGKQQKLSCDTAFCQYSSAELFHQQRTFILSDVEKASHESNPFVDNILARKVKSYIAAPLVYDDEIIGILEIGAKQPRVLNSIVANKLLDVIPLVTTALQRTVDEYETKLEAIIQAKCTAIHPTVNWRFMEAAEELVKKKQFFDTDEMDEIVFNQVYPLFGQSDIKGSSTIRNQAIQDDLIKQLSLARQVLETTVEKYPLPIYQELKFRINKFIYNVSEGLGAGDEIGVLDFLNSDIYPVFSHIEADDPALKMAVDAYNKALDPALGVVYEKRKNFEDSVMLINEKVSETIERQQDLAQEMLPHYFEKYKTDGVEYNIYIGQSLLKGKTYSPIHLQNLRLWQLLVTCEIENQVHALRPSMKVPMDICSLILVHGNPLSIRFRMDEKQFDVDGAYNIRYEIVKKRIDKAYIKNTKERLTQPGKIAIVYSQEKDAIEYFKYLEYLQFIKYVGSDVEQLELEDLPGANGLKALRVDVKYQKAGKKIASKAEALLKKA